MKDKDLIILLRKQRDAYALQIQHLERENRRLAAALEMQKEQGRMLAELVAGENDRRKSRPDGQPGGDDSGKVRMDDRARIAMTARMDGKRAIAERIGQKHAVSDMELVALCNFARLGLLATFAGVDGEIGEQAERELDEHAEAIRGRFGREGQADGLTVLTECCAAILVGERLGKYVVKIPRDHERE